MEEKGPKVEDYISQYTDVFTGESQASPATYTENPHCPPRATKTRNEKILEWFEWVDTPTNWILTRGHNKENMAKVDFALTQNHYMKLNAEIITPYLQ